MTISCTTAWKKRAKEEEHKVEHYHDGVFRYAIDLPLEKPGLDEQAARVLDGLFYTFEEFAEGDD